MCDVRWAALHNATAVNGAFPSSNVGRLAQDSNVEREKMVASLYNCGVSRSLKERRKAHHGRRAKRANVESRLTAERVQRSKPRSETKAASMAAQPTGRRKAAQAEHSTRTGRPSRRNHQKKTKERRLWADKGLAQSAVTPTGSRQPPPKSFDNLLTFLYN